jgi:hypothetical protein
MGFRRLVGALPVEPAVLIFVAVAGAQVGERDEALGRLALAAPAAGVLRAFPPALGAGPIEVGAVLLAQRLAPLRALVKVAGLDPVDGSLGWRLGEGGCSEQEAEKEAEFHGGSFL